MSRGKLWLLSMLVVACLAGTAWRGTLFVADEPEPKPDARREGVNEAALMRAKLASSQKVLEVLVDENFDLIHDGAKELVKITDATGLHAEEDQVYAHYRADLRRTALKLIVPYPNPEFRHGRRRDGHVVCSRAVGAPGSAPSASFASAFGCCWIVANAI